MVPAPTLPPAVRCVLAALATLLCLVLAVAATPADGTAAPAAPTTAPPTAPPTAGPTAGPTGTSPPTGRFYVVGSDIVGPDGNIFYPIGANAALKFTPYGYVFEGNNGGVNDHVDSVKAWNWNTIRATLICDNRSGVPSFTELVNGIDPVIRQLTEAKIVVMLECHDQTGKNPSLGSSRDKRIRRFWDEMVRRYSDNPYVWFNIYNEPDARGDTARWAKLHQFYVDRIRKAGADNLIVVDLPVWSQGIDLVVNGTAGDRINAACNT
ncbi:MAG: glycoside hydrolase family 5 protein, partial [Acidimicrobiia bacterium]|nr:glycoside hydrolase family 5 protein [Acidimicrobiia bacterium]